MADRLRAKVGLTYPTGASLEVVRKAGGIKKLTAEQGAELELKHVAAGEPCDDLPEESRKWMVAQGLVEVVKQKAQAKAVKPKRKKAKRGARE
jgi:hypothetical protein